MSYLFFLDESGHDHKSTPYEVRGGIVLHAKQLWPFVQNIKRLEEACFGDALHNYGVELKGHRLLDKDRFRWAKQDPEMDDVARRKHALGFLNKGLQKDSPTCAEFTAYGQACLKMARDVFTLLSEHNGLVFAVAIPQKEKKPTSLEATEYLRKDYVFLFERYFYFLEEQQETGLLVMDETDKLQDRNFVRRLEAYFSKTGHGRYRTQHIVPTPFFVSSDMAYPVQVADICIYCINWGFRLPERGMNAVSRPEIGLEFGAWLNRLQFQTTATDQEGLSVHSYSIAYVPDPYKARSDSNS